MFASLSVFAAMTLVVGVLAVYRKLVSRNEDDVLHLAEGTGQLIQNQQKVASSLRLIDRLGMSLTILTAAYGLFLLVWYLYTTLATRNVY